VARLPRYVLPPSGVYHVTSRGVARWSIAADDFDRRRWRGLLRSAIRAQRWECLAWCLMPNHFHLVLVAELERLSRGMHFLNFRYASAYNSRHDRVGHLFQDRFFAEVVEDDEHLAAVCDYVLDNPVRARLCAERSSWRWSGGLYA